MTSNDNRQYLTVEMFNSKMETFMTQIRLENEKLRGELCSEFHDGLSKLHDEIQEVRSELKTEIQVLQSEVRVNSAQIAELHHFMYWGIAILALIATVVPFLRREGKEKKQKNSQEQYQSGLTEQKVHDMIAQAIGGFKPTGK